MNSWRLSLAEEVESEFSSLSLILSFTNHKKALQFNFLWIVKLLRCNSLRSLANILFESRNLFDVKFPVNTNQTQSHSFGQKFLQRQTKHIFRGTQMRKHFTILYHGLWIALDVKWFCLRALYTMNRCYWWIPFECNWLHYFWSEIWGKKVRNNDNWLLLFNCSSGKYYYEFNWFADKKLSRSL